MFELSVALKYLIPKKKQLSVSLIALMSVLVISLVVWLVLIFLSVTDGIEKGWLQKLTSLNAPIRITPTKNYFSSYYYKIDSISADSQYSHKTIGEKADALKSDPYDPTQDMEIPKDWQDPDRKADGSLRDPVKEVYAALHNLQKRLPDIAFQDYEMSGAMMRLQMLRPSSQVLTSKGEELQSYLTQVSYLASFADKSPYLTSLLAPPNVADLNHLLFLANHARELIYYEKGSFFHPVEDTVASRLASIFENITLKQVKTSLDTWRLPPTLLPEGSSFRAFGFLKNGQLSHVVVPQKEGTSSQTVGTLVKQNGELFFKTKEKIYPIAKSLPLFVDKEMRFDASLKKESLEGALDLKNVQLEVTGSLQKTPIKGEIAWDGLEILDADVTTIFSSTPRILPPWPFTMQGAEMRTVLPLGGQKESGILIAKGFQDSGVKIGDRGTLSFATSVAGSTQEQKLPIFVAGFYDPGIMTVGYKCLLVPSSIVHSAIGMNTTFSLDPTLSNGIQVWFKDISKADDIKRILQASLEKEGISKYWKISTFKEYDFAKDLMQQFQSDKYLFTLVAGIILIVACCNIISLLVLLVNDKKREIGILQSMGASSKSIAAIFGFCGIFTGLLSSFIGISAALLTMHNIDHVVNLLSFLQGHEAFHAAFYGKSLPRELSSDALTFVLFATPIISFLAGLVPAIKACRLRPSQILRSTE